MPLLEVVNSRFSQKLRSSLSNSLRKMLDVTPDPIATVKYSDFQRSLPVPTSMHLFKMEPLRGLGILVVESRLVFSLVEAYFGGSGAGSGSGTCGACWKGWNINRENPMGIIDLSR